MSIAQVESSSKFAVGLDQLRVVTQQDRPTVKRSRQIARKADASNFQCSASSQGATRPARTLVRDLRRSLFIALSSIGIALSLGLAPPSVIAGFAVGSITAHLIGIYFSMRFEPENIAFSTAQKQT